MKSDLIDKYISVIIEYLNAMNSSEIVQEIEKKDFIIDCGLQSIIHIFKYRRIKINNRCIVCWMLVEDPFKIFWWTIQT
jgi:hypothetical protein